MTFYNNGQFIICIHLFGDAGTVPFNDLVLDIAGIDLQTWRKEDMFKETESRAASAMEWQPEVQVKVVEKEVIKEVIVQAEPKIIEVMKTPPPPPPESPKEVIQHAETLSITKKFLIFFFFLRGGGIVNHHGFFFVILPISRFVCV